jgi:uncharacterized protein
MALQPHYLLDVIIATCATIALGYFAVTARELEPRKRLSIWLALVTLAGLAWFSAALGTVRVARFFPGPFIAWVRCFGLFSSVASVYGALLFAAVRGTRGFKPSRRRAVKAVAAIAAAAPAGIAAFGILRRNDLQFREIDISVPGLPPDLNGLRIAQLTDIHLSNFVPEWLLKQAVGMANDARPHLTFVTGDLISVRGDPLDKCLEHLRLLRSAAGVFGCCGNHEVYTRAEQYVKDVGRRYGMHILRQEAVPLYFGKAVMNLVGVDHQRLSRPYLQNAEKLVNPDAFNVLMSHNPDVFAVAAKKGFDLTVAGHTHGGQIQFEILHPSLNIVRFATPYVYGTYEIDDKRMYVSRGVGTIGVPARVGAPPEVVCLRLCAT